MKLCLNRELVWKFLSWKLIILAASFVKLQFVEWPQNTEPRQQDKKEAKIAKLKDIKIF